MVPVPLAVNNVHNVLAGSNILIWVCFVGQAVFLDLETQKPSVIWVWEGYTALSRALPKY